MKLVRLSVGVAGLLVVAGCGSSGTDNSTPVNAAGTSSAGTSSAGSGSGGTSSGGSAVGGQPAGGSATGGTNTGGTAAGSAGTAAGGGAGSSGGGGGSGGGSSAKGFTCPAGSDAITPKIPTTAGSAVANVPPAGYDPENLEGPVWINGYLYLSEIAKRNGQAGQTQPQGGRIIRMQPGKAAEVFLTDVGTNGLAVNAAGDLVAASQKEGGIVSFDVAAPSPTPKKVYANMFDGKRFSSPNDVTIRDDGNIYFTDPAYQAGSVKQSAERAYRIDPTGKVSAIDGAPSPPNGITLSPDQKTLYVGGAKLMAYPVNADGSLGTGQDFPDQANGGSIFGTDGLGVDCAGNLYVTANGPGNVVVLKPSGAKLGSITVGSGVTNVAFGGPDNKTLFITKMNPPSLFAVPSDIPGYPY